MSEPKESARSRKGVLVGAYWRLPAQTVWKQQGESVKKNASGKLETSRILKLQYYRRMRIGDLARTGDVNVETIRYYQRIGLLELPEKPYGGTRSYDEQDLQRLRFIRRAQQLGFSLEDIRELLELSSSDCERVEELAAQKLTEVKAKLRQLRRIE